MGLRAIQALACTRYFQKYFQTQISTSADFKEIESMDMEIEGALCFPYANLLFTRWPHTPQASVSGRPGSNRVVGQLDGGPCPYLASVDVVTHPKQTIMKENKEKRAGVDWGGEHSVDIKKSREKGNERIGGQGKVR